MQNKNNTDKIFSYFDEVYRFLFTFYLSDNLE